MIFNNNKLRGLIKERYGSEYIFAKKLEMSLSTLSSKLNNKSEFNRSEILKMKELLEIKKEEIYNIFFCLYSS